MPQSTLTGTSTGSSQVRWSTDRGEAGIAAGSSTFTATVPLHPGRNRILVDLISATGALTPGERTVFYYPPAALTKRVREFGPERSWRWHQALVLQDPAHA